MKLQCEKIQNNIHLSSQLSLLLLFFITTLCDATYYECDQINEGDPMSYSWSMIVSLRYDCQQKGDPTTHCCSGTILTQSYILTAADCVDSLPNDITIVAGIYNRSKSEQRIRQIDQIIIHPKWINDRAGLKHNIALLHLANPLDFNVDRHITRTCSPTRVNLPGDVSKYPLNNTQLLAIESNSINKDFDAETPDNILSFVDNNDPKCKELIHDIEQQFCVRFYQDSKSLF